MESVAEDTGIRVVLRVEHLREPVVKLTSVVKVVRRDCGRSIVPRPLCLAE
jgi:hypothetical protein